jgi:isopenicillin N synthase-like dioxygenase
MTTFYWSLYSVSRTILQALALGIGLEENHLLSYHSGLNNQLRLLHYPSIPAASVESGKAARMPAHTDWSSMTMLFQDDCGGLEIERPNEPGRYVAATPVEGALVMNVGDLLQYWSNDFLKSTLHRVGLPPLADRFEGDERMTRERYSIVYFCSTDPDLVIECLRPDDGVPRKYEPITQREYGAMRARMQYPKVIERGVDS